MIKNNRGFTLVELLAVLALMSIIIILISSAHIFGQKQFINQAEEINHQSDARYIANLVAKDVRKASSLSVSGNELILGEVTYHLSGNTLKKNGSIIAESVSEFKPEVLPAEKGKGIKLSISTLANKQSKSAALETIIYARE